MLGATGGVSGLASQYIVVNIRHIDVDKLRNAIGVGVKGAQAAGVNAALAIVDSEPKMALDIALPLAKNYMKDTMGVDAELNAANVSPMVRGKSEFWAGAGIGTVAVATVFGIGWATWKLIFKRLF